ncbi:unnamed protein product, partial [Ascophyllum nodosum]
PAGAFIPYASGPRGCVGRPFASVVLRTILARLCLALDFSPASGEVVATGGSSPSLGSEGGGKEMQAGFTVLPRGGVHLRLRLWPSGSMEP